MEGGILKYKNNFCKSFLFRWKLWAIQNYDYYDIKTTISLSICLLPVGSNSLMLSVMLSKKIPVDLCRYCVRNLREEGLRYFFQRSIYWRKKTLRLQGIGTYANVDVIVWNFFLKMIATEDRIGSYGIIGFFNQRVEKIEKLTMACNLRQQMNLFRQFVYNVCMFIGPNKETLTTNIQIISIC